MIDKETKIPQFDVGDGDLTFVGKVMSDLPIPQQCTRLILLGHCFGVMQEATIIGNLKVQMVCFKNKKYSDFLLQFNFFMI